MKSDELQSLLENLIRGEITEPDHARLEELLKLDGDARARYRERMDLEASLHTWASEPDELVSQGKTERRSRRDWAKWVAVGLAASIAFLVLGWIWHNDQRMNLAEQVIDSTDDEIHVSDAIKLLGTLREQAGCRWDVRSVSKQGYFSSGKFALSEGNAELRFDSGTQLVLQAPCEVFVTADDSAKLMSGTAFVNVTEVSNGFTLATPESVIIDEGTEYAVEVRDKETEVHVFDGSVFWIAESEGGANRKRGAEDRIESGEARRYSRDNPGVGKFIPFGQRQFVRVIEARAREESGESLLAYDGFENLAGRVRRGRSGFGWDGGWTTTGRGRGRAAATVEAPQGSPFGLDRSNRRLLQLSPGDDVRRRLEETIPSEGTSEVFVSCLIEESSGTENTADEDHSIRFTFEPDLPGRGRLRHPVVTFGVTADLLPFINSGNRIVTSANPIRTGESYLCVLSISGAEDGMPKLRIYGSDEQVDVETPLAWNVAGTRAVGGMGIRSVRITAGSKAVWKVDELRVGTSWESVSASVRD